MTVCCTLLQSIDSVAVYWSLLAFLPCLHDSVLWAHLKKRCAVTLPSGVTETLSFSYAHPFHLTPCSTLQNTAEHCNTCTHILSTLHSATRCNTRQHMYAHPFPLRALLRRHRALLRKHKTFLLKRVQLNLKWVRVFLCRDSTLLRVDWALFRIGRSLVCIDRTLFADALKNKAAPYSENKGSSLFGIWKK